MRPRTVIALGGLLLGAPGCNPDQDAALPRTARTPRHAARTLRERLIDTYDVSNAVIDLGALIAPGVEKDGIPALTRPKRTRAAGADYPPDTGRVVAVTIAGESVAYPLGILNFHEIVNDEVGGVPIAATYCPLCDSVTVLDRRLEIPSEAADPETITLEFGVSGLLYNSNVVMYERRTMGLWSQVYMQAVSGPHVGRTLDHLPFRMMTFGEFKRSHPDGFVLTTDTGYRRPYDVNPYAEYFSSERTFRGMRIGGDALAPKTLGVGVRAGEYVTFVTAEAAMNTPITLATPLGNVVIEADEVAGIRITRAPPGADLVQTFYHSWSAFFPQTEVVTGP